MVANVHEAKMHFSRSLERAMAGEKIIIAGNGSPLVRLTPIAAPEGERIAGLSKGDEQVHRYNGVSLLWE
ncbi:MAG: type II toxin-antitoxin system Phd/YefM family antitoxin [Spirochaetaceae bacterium]